jgi:hypothetical protein
MEEHISILYNTTSLKGQRDFLKDASSGITLNAGNNFDDGAMNQRNTKSRTHSQCPSLCISREMRQRVHRQARCEQAFVL